MNKYMKRVTFLCCVLVLAMTALVGCGKKGEGKTESKFKPDTVVATVDGEKYYYKDLEERVNVWLKSYGLTKESQQYPATVMGVLETWVRDDIICQLAEQNGVTISDEELKEAEDELTEMYGGVEEFAKYREQIGASDELFKETFKAQLLSNELGHKLVGDIKPSDEDLREFFNKYAGNYSLVDSVSLKQVVCDTRENAEKAKIEFDGGNVSFDEIYAKYNTVDQGSGDKSKPVDAVAVAKENVTDDKAKELIWNTEAGHFSTPLEVMSQGWVLFYPVSFTEAKEAVFEECKDDVELDYIYVQENQKLIEYVNEEMSKRKIEYKVEEANFSQSVEDDSNADKQSTESDKTKNK